MSFASKLIAYSAAASLAMAVSPILQAQSIHLEYKDYAGDTEIAKTLWGDMLPDAKQLNGKPSISVATVDRGDVHLQVSMLFATSDCGINTCPIRVFQDGHKIEDTMACDNISTHALSESMRALVTCDDVTLIHRK